MRKLQDAVLAAPVGFVVAGLIELLGYRLGIVGYLAGHPPAFYWEDVGCIITLVAFLSGAVAGAVGAASGKWMIGARAGSVLAGSVLALLYFSGQVPALLVLWGVVVVSVAAPVAAFHGVKIGQTN